MKIAILLLAAVVKLAKPQYVHFPTALQSTHKPTSQAPSPATPEPTTPVHTPRPESASTSRLPPAQGPTTQASTVHLPLPKQSQIPMRLRSQSLRHRFVPIDSDTVLMVAAESRK